MCIALKYGIWNVTQPEAGAVNALTGAGCTALCAMVLAARGIATGEQANAYLSRKNKLLDPFLMADMAAAAARVRAALQNGEKIAVFGDYDVDGITATSLLTDFLRSCEGNCVPYIPGRLEEGYGLNAGAIQTLYAQGVRLIVTVDCGITAIEEARLCRSLGIDLVITDHHECKQCLPEAVAVVDPHRADDTYPHRNLSGVGVAFKLACALSGDAGAMLRRYADLVCLGTVADVMPLVGENRTLVWEGLQSMRGAPRVGVAALMEACACDRDELGVTTIGYILAPRINAAGRMGKIETALELFLTGDIVRAQSLAEALCEMNRERQAVESEIYRQAVAMLPRDKTPDAIVLADEGWHQGVVGIVASRISEEYCCPTALICLDGEHGKASSRSYAGFNLFTSLTALSPLLENYGGHEFAAGFTIRRDNIPDFRAQLSALAAQFYSADVPRTALDVDCAVPPEILTERNVESLAAFEPCGSGLRKPVLMMTQMRIERIQPVGGGKHIRLRLRCGRIAFNAIFFSATARSASIAEGDVVDVAFHPEINEFRAERSVQLNVVDIRPSCRASCPVDTADYHALRAGELTKHGAEALLPDRHTLGIVWRYLSLAPQLLEAPMCLQRKIVRYSGEPLSLGRLLTCLDIFRDVGLIEMQRRSRDLFIRPISREGKADLSESATMQTLLRRKES